MAPAAAGLLPRPPRLRLGEVHVWLVTGGEDGPGEPATALLSASERERASRYRCAADERRFVFARSLLRLLLGAYVGHDPRALSFDTTCTFCDADHGKPRLLSAGAAVPEFSLSYTEGAALLAVARKGRLGADVEAAGARHDGAGLLGPVATEAEAEALRGLEPAHRGRALLGLWTLKEAALKASGRGLAIDPRSIEIEGIADERPRVASAPRECPEMGRWWLRRLSLGPALAGAVASSLTPRSLLLQRLDPLSLNELINSLSKKVL